MRYKLLSYIDLYLDNYKSALSQSSVLKMQRLRRMLSLFPGCDDADLQMSQDADFRSRFADFLSGEQEYAEATVGELIGDLRKISRNAIRQGLLPNVDANPIDLDTRKSIERLFAKVEKWSVERLSSENSVDKTVRRQQHEKAVNYRCISIYLFGLSCYGLEIEDVITLKNKDITADGIYLAKYSTTLPLTAAAMRLIDIHNTDTRRTTGSATCEYIFSTLNDNRSDKTAAEKADEIARRVRRIIQTELGKAVLFRSQSVYDDWISLAVENGLSFSDAERFVRLRHEGYNGGDTDSLLINANNRNSPVSKEMTSSWYLLKLLPKIKNPKTIVDEMIATRLLGASDDAERNIYNPIDRLVTEKESKRGPLNRFIFFKATPAAAMGINLAMLGKAHLLRNRATQSPAIVNESELRKMQLAIRDFRDDMQLIDKEDWLRRNEALMKIGGKVKILSGSLKGAEATIVDITSKSGKTGRVYLLEYVGGSVTFKTSLRGIDLDPINI